MKAVYFAKGAEKNEQIWCSQEMQLEATYSSHNSFSFEYYIKRRLIPATC